MATKEVAKHPIFRQYDAEDIVEIILTDGDGAEIAVVPGNRSETDIKRASQENGYYGPVNLLARMSNGTTNGPVQVSVPAPRVSAESVFRKSKLAKAVRMQEDMGEEPQLPDIQKVKSVELIETPSLAMDSMQRLDRIATESMSTERARVDKERTFWQAKFEEEREEARRREEAISEAAQRREEAIAEAARQREQELAEAAREREQELREREQELINMSRGREAEFNRRIEEERRRVAEEREIAMEREQDVEARYAQQMEMLRDSQDQLLRETKGSMQAKINAMAESYEKAMQEIKESQDARARAITEAHEKTLADLKMSEEFKIRHVSADSEDKVTLVRQMSEQATRFLENSNVQTISTMKSQLELMSTRIRDLEAARERESETARTRYEDFRDRMNDEINRLREEKSKAEQSRLEMMLTSQKSSSEDIRREVDRVQAKYESELKESRNKYESEIKEQKTKYDQDIKEMKNSFESQLKELRRSTEDDSRERNRMIESLQTKAETLTERFREESTKAEIASIREQSNREPLKTERLMPLLSALPAEQRANLVSRAIASDLDIDLNDEREEPKKPSLVDSIGDAIKMLAMQNMANANKPAQPAPQPQPQPQPRPVIVTPQQQQPQRPVQQPQRPVQQAQRPAAPTPAPQPPQAAAPPISPLQPPAQSGALGDSEEV